MSTEQFKQRHLRSQILYEFTLLEYELEQKGKAVPRLSLKEPQALLQQIKNLRFQLNTTNTSQ